MITDNKKGTGNKGTAMGTGFASMSDAPQQPQNQQDNSGLMSFNDLGMEGPIAASPGPEILNTLVTSFEEVMKKNDSDKRWEVTFLKLNMEATQSLTASAVIVCIRDQHKPEFGVAFHTLLVAAASVESIIRVQPIFGENVEILSVTGDAFTDAFNQEVIKIVAERFPQSRCINADGHVVKRTFDPSNTSMSRMILWAASQAAVATLISCNDAVGNTEINLSRMKRDTTLTVEPSFGQPQAQDIYELPVRSDVVINFNSDPNNGQTPNNQPQNVSRPRNLAVIRGFADLIYGRNQNHQQPTMYMQPGQMQQHPGVYNAHFIITHMQSVLASSSAILFNIAAALSIRDNNLLSQAFWKNTQNLNQQEVKHHDFGAATIEFMQLQGRTNAEASKYLETQSADFTEATFMSTYNSVMIPGMVLSMDIGECESDTWLLLKFLLAARGDKAAIRDIVDAADTLTNNHFSTMFDANTMDIVEDSGNRIHLGFYTDAKGVKRDLREIDYLTIASKAAENEDLEIIVKWSESFSNTAIPLDKRLFDRKRIMERLFSNIEITGFARRVTFTAGFLEALAKSILACNFIIRPNMQYRDAGSYQRAIGNTTNTLLAQQSTGLFNYTARGPAYVNNSGNGFANFRGQGII